MFTHFSLRILMAAAGLIFAGIPSQIMAVQQYKVVKGDNLYRIGKKFGIPYQEIMAANKLRSSLIHVNQILVIPDKTVVPPSAPIQSAPRAPRATTIQPPAIIPMAPVAPRFEAPAPPVKDFTLPGPGHASTYQLPTPHDPVEPFVSARKLPGVPDLPPSPPKLNREDPLGVGNSPAPSHHRNVLPPRPSTQPRISRPIQPSFPELAKAPSLHREVPAAAYPNQKQISNTYQLDPQQFPTPSFDKVHKPSRLYTVESGDSVWTISRKFGVSPIKLRRVNNIMLSNIRPGMKLTIPDSHGIWSL